MKKILSFILVMVMFCSMTVTAFAAEDTYTLTITGAAGHTYDVYQIYTGDIAKEGETTVLSNVKYGQNHYPVNGKPGDPVSADELSALIDGKTAVDILDSAISGAPIKNDVAPSEGENTIAISGLDSGYYMIVDVSENLPEGTTKSPIMLQIVENVTVASKHASITSEKKVDDKNDSVTDEDAVNWQDSADYDIGDAVPFKLTCTIPSTYNTYENYTLTFHDSQATGFAAPVISKVYFANATGEQIGNALSDNDYTVDQTCGKNTCDFGNACSFTVTVAGIEDKLTSTAYTEGCMLVVEYTAVLENAAVVGDGGNENGMYVCHPDGHTPEDYVIVFTYELNGNKIDGATQKPLTGAGFTLYKWDADSNAEDKWVAVGNEVKGEEMTTFTWSGIDDGRYKLVETTTPAGYNTMAPIEFVVTAQHKAEWIKGGNSAFLDLIAKDVDGNIVFADAKNVEGVEVEDGKLDGTLVNNKGTVLPETGAEGTIMFIAVGSLLAMVAVVFMITRKKMSVYER